MGGGLSGLKLDKFRGKDGEDIVGWLEDAEMYFDLRKIPEEHKTAATVFSLRGDAKSFYRYCYDKNNKVQLTWAELQHALRSRYEAPFMRRGILRDGLRAIPYRGPQNMIDYCEKFREVEIQVHDMNFYDRFEHFIVKLPSEARMAIENQEGLRKHDDMELVYRGARQWAASKTHHGSHSGSLGGDSRMKHRDSQDPQGRSSSDPMPLLLNANSKASQIDYHLSPHLPCATKLLESGDHRRAT
jgi:hypothetical protein